MKNKANTDNQIAWLKEVAERCEAFDNGQISERDSADVLKDAYKNVTQSASEN